MSTETEQRQYWTYYLTKAIETRRSVSIILKENVVSQSHTEVKPPHLSYVIPVGAIEYLLQQERYGLIQLFVEDARIAHAVLDGRRWTTPSDRLLTFFPDAKLDAKEFLLRLDPALEDVGYAFHSFQDR